jgi:hypothetical protein
MGLESGTFINDLVTTNPVGASDAKSQGDNHLRLIKTVAKNTFPNASRALYFPTTIASQTGTVNVVAADQNKTIPINAVSAPITVNLPANASIPDGFEVTVIKIDSSANAVTIDGNGADTINGAATVQLTRQYQSFRLIWCGPFASWVGFRVGSAEAVDATLAYTGNNLGRAALTGAVAASAGSNATTAVTQLCITIGDGVNVITTGTKGFLSIDFAATITGWTLCALQSGSCVLDVWKAAGSIPSNANTITGSEKPTLSSQQRAQDNSLSSWTTAVSANDVFGFEVESATTVTQVTLGIRMTKTS